MVAELALESWSAKGSNNGFLVDIVMRYGGVSLSANTCRGHCSRSTSLCFGIGTLIAVSDEEI